MEGEATWLGIRMLVMNGWMFFFFLGCVLFAYIILLVNLFIYIYVIYFLPHWFIESVSKYFSLAYVSIMFVIWRHNLHNQKG